MYHGGQMDDYYEQIHLQRAADYRMVRNDLHASGKLNLVFGVVAIISGSLHRADNPLNGVLLWLGVCLLVSVLATLGPPTRLGVLVAGIMLLLAGAWNVIAPVLAARMSPEAGTAWWWMALGAVQFVWAVVSLWRWREHLATVAQPPLPEHLSRVSFLAAQIMNETPAGTGEEEVRFRSYLLRLLPDSFVPGFLMLPWKGHLGADHLAILVAPADQILFGRREDVTVIVRGELLFGRGYSASVRVGNRTLECVMAPEALAAFERWKAEAPVLTSTCPLRVQS